MGKEGESEPVGGADNGSGTAESGAESTDEEQTKTSTCATCWQQIPPGRVRCPHCHGSGQSGGDESETWSYDRVVLAVVPAEDARSAKRSAATAFARGRNIVSGTDVSHGEVTLRAAFEMSPPSGLTTGWPTVPSAVPVTSSTGQSLFETAATRCEASETTDPMIYCEDGAAVADAVDVETLEEVIDSAAVQYWVVPGLVKRYSLPDEPEAFGDPLYCVDCAAVTEHDTSDTGSDAASEPERQLWACRVCGAQRYGPD